MSANFQAERTTLNFWPKFAQKRILWLEFRNSKPVFGISTSNMPWEPIFMQNGQLWIFCLNLGKLPNYMGYFGYYNVEGVAESWVEVKMSWVHGLVISIFFWKWYSWSVNQCLWSITNSYTINQVCRLCKCTLHLFFLQNTLWFLRSEWIKWLE